MGHRLSRIVTKTGDRGQTSLGSGVRVDKDAPAIEALGTIDELNSWIGVLITLANSPEVRETFELVQHDLFDLGAQVSVPGTPLLSSEHLLRIESAFAQMNTKLGMLKEFILPGGERSSAFAHVARTVCRRAERRLFTLCEVTSSPAEDANHDVPPQAYGLAYLNRLSDLLFVASRIENKFADRPDILWQKGKSLS
ncbi:MAG: cob(I)yrinic acid a,c-diamide adenosyltransferase [Rhizobiaceae bacterium]|jgi:cob(I)alamin adenosyltransferase|nr:cob(I)yrinic acid a,c-diamide adenosyltransferase [Bellilinea sp.]